VGMTVKKGKAPSGEKDLREMASTLRRWIVEQSFRSGVGHIGSALSVADIMAVLWGSVMREPGTSSPGRDRFVLAKGHAALALFASLRWKGLLTEKDFGQYCRDGSPIGAHPEHAVRGVDVSTGSLGQGLSVACGMAFGLRLKKNPARIFVLMSDAECNEGQVWEAAQFSAHHGLSSLTAVVDLNGLQALGPTRDILDLSPLAGKWRAFGWDVVEVDGHNIPALLKALGAGPGKRPRMVVARTVMGKGVSFMEGKVEWHYRNLDAKLAVQALKELGGGK